MAVKSNFKLDDRIKSIDDIQTILRYDVNCIGCKGYFFDEFIQTKDLSKCRYGELIDITDNRNDLCFKAKLENENTVFYRFFIPEDDLKPIEKKYRPYSLAEWTELHEIGEMIHFRHKSINMIFHHMYVGYEMCVNAGRIKGTERISIGNANYDLAYLFENYEINIGGEWVPFGIEDEE